MKKSKHSRCRFLSLLLCALLLGSAAAPGAAVSAAAEELPTRLGITEETDEEYIGDYRLLCENAKLALYADTDKGWFALKNKKSGKLWYSTPNDTELDETTSGSSRMDVRSDYVIQYQDITANTETSRLTFNSHEQAVRDGTVDVEPTADGMKVTYRFTSFGITMPVSYRLLDDSLEVRVHVDELEETDVYAVVSVRVLPNFGAGSAQTDGWMLIPDGSGAIARFNNGRYAADGYEAMVYGPEYAETQEIGDSSVKQAVRLPVFGIGQGTDALFGVITQGESSTALRAEFSGDSFWYNTLSPTLRLRTVSNIRINSQVATRVSDNDFSAGELAVRYYCLDGDEADYVGMAQCYRRYLVEEQGMEKTAPDPALVLDVYGAIDVKANFLGIPYKKLRALTTFAQAGDIAEALTAQGVGTLALRYEGWTDGGLMNKKIPQSAKPLSVLGGKKAFTALTDRLDAIGAQLYPEVDLLRFRSGGSGVRRGRDAIKDPFGEVVEQPDYMLSVYAPRVNSSPFYLLRASAVQRVSERFFKNYAKLGLDAVSLGTAGDLFYADLRAGGGLSRTALATAYDAMWAAAGERSVAVTGGNAWVAARADRVFAAPLCSSGCNVFDHDVPFYQIVFRGYTALTTAPIDQVADRRLMFLNAVETGTELMFGAMAADGADLPDTDYSRLYSTSFSLWADEAAAMDKEYRPLLTAVSGQAITGHAQLADGLFKTTYENGVTVYVNYNEAAVQADGLTIGGMSFEARGF